MGKPELRADDLLARGFNRASHWRLNDGRLKPASRFPDEPGVYVFSIEGVAQYVGLASKSLARRIYGYEKPGPSQRTNLRLNELLLARAGAGDQVDILVASPPELEWHGWPISGAEGLEAALINGYSLLWNVRGSRQNQVVPRSAAVPAEFQAEHAASNRYSGKYVPLRTFLEGSRKQRISMTFSQIEDLVGELPKSATLHAAWWANHEGNSQAKAWMAAGYIVDANPAGRSVIFRRILL